IVSTRAVQAEDVREPPLDQPVPARHGFRDRESPGREADLVLRGEPDVTLPLHPAERLGHGGRRELHVPREAGADDRFGAALKVVDRREVVLDRGRFHGAIIRAGRLPAWEATEIPSVFLDARAWRLLKSGSRSACAVGPADSESRVLLVEMVAGE